MRSGHQPHAHHQAQAVPKDQAHRPKQKGHGRLEVLVLEVLRRAARQRPMRRERPRMKMEHRMRTHRRWTPGWATFLRHRQSKRHRQRGWHRQRLRHSRRHRQRGRHCQRGRHRQGFRQRRRHRRLQKIGGITFFGKLREAVWAGMKMPPMPWRRLGRHARVRWILGKVCPHRQHEGMSNSAKGDGCHTSAVRGR